MQSAVQPNSWLSVTPKRLCGWKFTPHPCGKTGANPRHSSRGNQVGDLARQPYDPAGKHTVDLMAEGRAAALARTQSLLALSRCLKPGLPQGAMAFADRCCPHAGRHRLAHGEVKSTSVKDHRDDVATVPWHARPVSLSWRYPHHVGIPSLQTTTTAVAKKRPDPGGI
jgi:hypothetical protein